MADRDEPPDKRARKESTEEPKSYKIQKIHQTVARKFGVEEFTYKAKFSEEIHGSKVADIRDDVKSMFDDVLLEVERNYDPDEKVRLSINHEGLDREMTIHLQNRENITSEMIMNRFNAVLNSKKDLSVNDSFEIKVGVMRREDRGGGIPIINTDVTSKDCSILKKRSMILIRGVKGENLCAARAIVTCMAKLNNEDHKSFKNMIHHNLLRSENPSSQRMRAINLMQQAGLPLGVPVSVRELFLFEDLLNVQIIVVSGDLCNEICYSGFQERDRKIFLYLKDEHFHSITNMQGLFQDKLFCQDCLIWYGKNRRHACKTTCFTCQQSGCLFDASKTICDDCNMLCRNTECFNRHKKPIMYKKGDSKGLERLSPPCETYHRCKKCERVLNITKRSMNEHECGEWFCKLCQCFVIGEHLCYYRITSPKETAGKFVYYDFETSQDTTTVCENGFKNSPKLDCADCLPDYQCAACRKCVNCRKPYCGLKRHLPNFLVAQTCCEACKMEPWTDDSKCAGCGDRCKMCAKKDKDGVYTELCANNVCGRREMIFSGDDTVKDFCVWLFQPIHKNFVAIAHNAKSFDAHLVLAYCMENSIQPASIIYQGSKIMKMRVNHGVGITFIDSLSFLPMALKKLPKALGLDTALKKGFFPHFYNRQGNFHFVGRMPAAEYYGVDFFSKADREEFHAWYADNSDQIFDFQKEILEYTRSDVTILREACTKFRELIREATTLENVNSPPIDVFAHTTLASCSMQIIRQLTLQETHHVFMKDGRCLQGYLKAGNWTDAQSGTPIDRTAIEKTCFIKSQIPQIPIAGYTGHFNHSQKAIMWLEWVSKETGDSIIHARNGGEFHIPGTRFRADGYNPATNTVLEFYGCRYHGHGCMASRTVRDPRTGFSMKELYNMCMIRENQIKSLGFAMQTIWECQWDRMVKNEPALSQFIEEFDLPPPLKIRDALMGGRTCPVKLFHDCTDNEKIRYYDVTSLYPWVNLNMTVPTCHPEIITDPAVMDLTLEPYFGIVKAKILPPTDLYLPVLPYRTNCKLIFTLCRSCADHGEHKECTCTETKRALTGTWFTEELKLALKKGYKILKLYEVYNYRETTTYDKDTDEGGLFKEYVHMFMQLKQQASGYPPYCITDEQKDKYISYYHLNQGVLLDKEKIQVNPGLRLVAKLFLNSCWGKFCEKPNKTQTVFVRTVLELTRLRNDPAKELVDFHIINPEIIAVEIRSAASFEQENMFTNEIIGALTTSYARIHLYSILEKTGLNTVYYDTDSVVFIQTEDVMALETGELLGELTDELGDERYIKTFVSSGPKCYAYKLDDGSSTLKLKGISLNFRNSQVIDFETVRKVVFNELEDVRTPHTTQITRDKHTGILYNRPFSKIYKKVFTKRRLLRNSFNTVPFGYRGELLLE